MRTTILNKLFYFIMAGAAFYIAGMYRQMPLMILAVMAWILLIFLFFISRYLSKKINVSFPVQSSEAEKGSSKKCRIHVDNRGRFPLKHICILIKVYDEEGRLLQKNRIHRDVERLTGNLDVEISPPCCGLLRVQICGVRVYDYLSVFSALKTVREELQLVVVPKTKLIHVIPFVGEAARQQEETGQRDGRKYFGNESREIRQIREYRMGDTIRYIHWNQSAKTGKLWMKEFEREEENFFEILLDLMIPDGWRAEEKEDFYELLAALTLGLLQDGQFVNVCWYQKKTEDFMTVAVENRNDYLHMMEELYRSGFVERKKAVEAAYEKKQSVLGKRMLKCNLRLECYDVKGGYGEELKQRLTYENLEEEWSKHHIFSLR